MRVQGLNIALRPRPSWEAVDLGVALVRRHARPIFASWALATGAAFLGLNALLLPFELAWLAALLLWWLKPAFDALPLLVLSRAIMGEQPGVRDALRAWRQRWRALVPWLLWRRLHPLRSMLMAVDLLEGEQGARRAERVRALGAGEGSTPMLLWVIGLHLELMLWGSVIVFGLMLVPTEFLDDSAKALWDLLVETPPWWMEAGNNALYWLAMAVVEPFYVGAGFALYLNRRTLLEGWDIELAFRRLATRLARGSAAAVVCLGLLLPAYQASAQGGGGASKAEAQRAALEQDEAAKPGAVPTRLARTLAAPADAEFARHLAQALADPDLAPKRSSGHWRLREPGEATAEDETPSWAGGFAAFVALVIENIGWILLALGIVLLLANARRWLPWLVARAPRAAAERDAPAQEHAVPPALPADLAAAVRARWQAGDPRGALSLFYRGALAALVERVGTPLPPGATEDDGLRHARRLGAQPFAALFRRIVLSWQTIAYAHRAPSQPELDALLEEWCAQEPPA